MPQVHICNGTRLKIRCQWWTRRKLIILSVWSDYICSTVVLSGKGVGQQGILKIEFQNKEKDCTTYADACATVHGWQVQKESQSTWLKGDSHCQIGLTCFTAMIPVVWSTDTIGRSFPSLSDLGSGLWMRGEVAMPLLFFPASMVGSFRLATNLARSSAVWVDGISDLHRSRRDLTPTRLLLDESADDRLGSSVFDPLAFRIDTKSNKIGQS